MALVTPVRRSRRSTDFDPPTSVKANRTPADLKLDLLCEKKDDVAQTRGATDVDVVKLQVVDCDGDEESGSVEFVIGDCGFHAEIPTVLHLLSVQDAKISGPPRRLSISEFIQAQQVKRKASSSDCAYSVRQAKRKLGMCGVSVQETPRSAAVRAQSPSRGAVPAQIIRVNDDCLERGVEFVLGNGVFQTDVDTFRSMVIDGRMPATAASPGRPRRATVSEFLLGQQAHRRRRST